MADLLPAVAELRATLGLPPGLPGSGRQRYGAAMALNRAGLISDAVLEVYRICSPLDAEDPGALLAARGLSTGGTGPDAATRLSTLVEEADQYLARLSGPGLAEVRAGIAAARGETLVPDHAGAGAAVPRTRKPGANPVVSAWLAPALAAVGGAPALVAAIRAAAGDLDWVSYDLYPRDQIGEDFLQGHAFATLIGAGGPIPARDFDFGLFLIAPHLLYRDHCHPAPELYAPLTGPHGWRFGTGAPLLTRAAHRPVWNEPEAPHLTRVGAMPFLALYAWTRDVDLPARVIPAADWPELEAWRPG